MLWMSTVSKHSSFRSVCTTCFVVSIWTIIYLALGAFPSILVWTIQNGTLILLADPSLTACPGFSLVFLFLFLMLLLSFPLAGPFSHSVCTLYSSDLRLLASVLTCRQSLFYCFTVNCFFFFPPPKWRFAAVLHWESLLPLCFPASFVHFLSLSHVLVILAIFQNIFFYYIWYVICDQWSLMLLLTVTHWKLRWWLAYFSNEVIFN